MRVRPTELDNLAPRPGFVPEANVFTLPGEIPWL